jgi:hypothetical protein
LQLAEFSQHSIIRRLDELRTLRCARYLKGLSYNPQCLIDIGELELDIRVGNLPQLVELRASAGDAANAIFSSVV